MKLKVSFGRTINLGDYESARLDAGLEIEIEVDEYQDARQSYLGELQDFIDSQVEELKGVFLEPKEEKVVPEKESTKKKETRRVSPGFGGSAPVVPETELPYVSEDMELRHIRIMPYEGKSYLIKRDSDGKVAFIGKSLVKSIDEKLGILRFKDSKWFTLDKIEWKEDKY